MTDQKSLAQHSPEIALLPLKDIVVFPHMIVPVFISEDLCIQAVEHALSSDRKLFLSAFSVPGFTGAGLESSLEPPFDIYDIGTVCTVMRTRQLPDGRMKVLVQGLQKAKVISLNQSEPYPTVRIDYHQEPQIANSSSEIEALTRVVRENLEKVVSLGKILSPDILMILEDVHEPGRLADLVGANLGLKVNEAQGILAISNPVERLKHVHAFLSREIEVYQMQVRIQSQAKEEITRMQKEHYLREQMRAIKHELGDGDSKDEIEELWQKLAKVEMSEEAKEEVKRQLKRLERMHQDTSEASLTRNYVETVIALPWNKYSADQSDIKNVKKILDEDHYGLEKIKERIIEFIAVKKLNPNAKSPILCFVGPPGVGKTSLGKSIAKSTGREFARISVGGVRDEADIRGHRKTYVGAFPGRIITAIKKSGVSNPVIMLDEIDKMGNDYRGDPAAALLEVLDPEQNKNFVDHYLGVSFDLSKVTFIANANSLSTIPAPLRDRLEIIEVSGYTEEEKVAIANQYIIPKQIQENGLGNLDIQFSKPSVTTLINSYTRESGLRGLEKQIASVCRKVARQFAEADETATEKVAIRVTPSFVQKSLGAEKFSQNFFHSEPTIGVSLGMAFTQYGGEVLAIESNLIPTGSHKLVLTGQLGEVMKESGQAALSYIRSKAAIYGISEKTLKENEIHVHVPQGGVPKDGPSAGTALATSIISALIGLPPRSKTCMTGEITLLGKVLPIGGVKEKVLAAQREGMTDVILPEKNRPQQEELPDSVKKHMKFHFVSDYDEVFAIMFNEYAMRAGGINLKSSDVPVVPAPVAGAVGELAS